MFFNCLLIALGGSLGALSRYGVVNFIQHFAGIRFPYGTLLVNVLGSFCISFIFIFLLDRILHATAWRNLLIVGFLGAFTTFSSFALETLNLWQQGEIWLGLINIIANVSFCLFAALLGLLLAMTLFK